MCKNFIFHRDIIPNRKFRFKGRRDCHSISIEMLLSCALRALFHSQNRLWLWRHKPHPSHGTARFDGDRHIVARAALAVPPRPAYSPLYFSVWGHSYPAGCGLPKQEACFQGLDGRHGAPIEPLLFWGFEPLFQVQEMLSAACCKSVSVGMV